MKNLLAILFVTLCTAATAQVKMGDNPSAISVSSILELESTNKALLVTRVADSSFIATPVNGMVIYDNLRKCLKAYANNTWVPLTPCVYPITAATSSFTSVVSYNGISPINDPLLAGQEGVGYFKSPLQAGSTISITVNVTVPGTYSYTATDASSGITYSASGTFASTGSQTVVLLNNAASPAAYGTRTMTLTGASNTLALAPRIDLGGKSAVGWVEGTDFQPVTALDGRTWMDRNLGAARVATSSTDQASFGNYFQRGRGADVMK